MITIEYKEHGVTFSDFKAEETARSFCYLHNKTKEDALYIVSNECIVDAMKLMVLEGAVSHNDVQFKFNDEILKINELGEIEKYPKGFCDQNQEIMRKVVYLRREKLKQK